MMFLAVFFARLLFCGWGGVHEPALAAGSLLNVPVEALEHRRKLPLDVGQHKIFFVKEVVALPAKPHQPVFLTFHSLSFYHESDRIFEPLW